MTATVRYTRMHNALTAGASRAGVPMHSVRVLVAVADRGGEATTREVTGDVASARELAAGRANASQSTTAAMVRRAVSVLRDHELLVTTPLSAAERGSGESMTVTLTDTGRVLAGEVLRDSEGEAT
jgi:hypothetical protein